MASKFVKSVSKLIGSQKYYVARDWRAICVEIEDSRLASERSQSNTGNAQPPPYLCCDHKCGATAPPPPYSP